MWDMDNLQTLCRRHHIFKTGRENRIRHQARKPAEQAAWDRLLTAMMDGG